MVYVIPVTIEESVTLKSTIQSTILDFIISCAIFVKYLIILLLVLSGLFMFLDGTVNMNMFMCIIGLAIWVVGMYVVIKS